MKKSRFIKTLVALFAFLLILFASLYFLRPAYREIDGRMRQAAGYFLSEFSESTGLGLSYDSISPSILTGITIRNIRVYDVQSGEVILSVKKAVFRYSLLKLLARDFDHAFSVLSVSEIRGKLSKEKLDAVRNSIAESRERKRKAKERVQGESAGDIPDVAAEDVKEEDGALLVQDSGISLQVDGVDKGEILSKEQKAFVNSILASLPAKVSIKDFDVSYLTAGKRLDLKLGRLSFNKKSDRNIRAVADSGSILFRMASGSTAAARFSANGNIVPGFSGSSAILTLNPHSSADFTVQKTQLLVRYADFSIVARSTQRLLPYSISAEYDIAEQKARAELELNGMSVLSLVKFPLKTKKIKELAGTPLTLKANAFVDIKNRAFSWAGEGGFDLPAELLKSEEKVSFKASGTESLLTVDRLSVSGKALKARLSGKLDLKEKIPDCSLVVDSYVLPNGNSLAFSAFVRADGRTVHALIPSLNLGESSFSSINAVARVDNGLVPFSFSISSSSPSGADPSSLSGNGTFYWAGGKKLSAGITMNSLFADSVANTVVFFLDSTKAGKIKRHIKRLSSLAIDGSLSFSTDFKDINYDINSFSVKDTLVPGREFTSSLYGDMGKLDVRKLSLDWGPVHLKAEADALMSLEDKEVNFNTSMDLNGILYDFTGSFAKGRWFNLSGSYGIDIIANLENGASGNAKILSFPFSFKNYEFSISLDGDFNVKNLQDFMVNIKTLQLAQEKGKLDRSPKLSLAGKLDPMGFIIDSISYSDINSSNGGSGYILWNINDGILDSATVSVGMSSELTKETITLAGDFTNPLHAPLTKDNLLHDCYFSILSDIRGFPLMRFIPNQYADDTFNGSIVASGTVENPYVSVKLENFSLQLGTKPVIVNGTAELLEGDLYIPALDIVWGGMKLSGFTADLDLTSFNGEASGEYSMRVLGDHYIMMPLKLSVRNGDENQERHSILEKFVPVKFVVDVDSSIACEGIMNGTVPLKGYVSREGRDIYFATDRNLGVTGSFLTETGALSIKVNESKPLHGHAEGTIKKSNIDLAIKDIKGDFSKFHDMFSTKSFGLYGGLASGYLSIKGMTSDPSLDGTLLLRNVDVGVPAVTEEHLISKNILITMFGQRIQIPESRILAGTCRMDLSALLRKERWGIRAVDVAVKTVENDRLPVKMAIPRADVKGQVALDAAMHFEDAVLKTDINGTIDNGEVSIVTMLTNIRPIGTLVSLSGGTVREAKVDDGKPSLWESLTRKNDVIINVNATVGRKVDLLVPPLIQAVVNPGTKFEFALDTSQSSWSMKSDVGLKGGHLTYLSRNFYLREGQVTLNESEKSFNPLITARAETKERDSDGIVVTLVLEAIKQSFQAFSPHVYSNPARSEAQIMAMLGQVVAADSDNAGSFLLSGLDYGIQFSVFKKMENALRDLLNFDIFSVRMNILQNTLSYGRSVSRGTYNGAFNTYSNPLGNFLDNASVYMGKYFGDSIYADALLQFTYDEYSQMTGAGVLGSGIVFRPELGIEFQAPFANIRWNFAPDLEPLRYGNVPDIVAGNSITLSWRFTF
ncbi:MAG: hypothetical protein IJU95_05360 [Treponema sp.]|nr:hypothetical protein [Treponema sp.]